MITLDTQVSSLTPEQKLTVDSLHVNTIVPAGAGAGKTRVLVERFLQIVEENPRGRENVLETIIAITFTEKAALEMRERVRRGIEEKIKHFHEKGDFQTLVKWQKALNDLYRASISTFHSFCARLLREYPVEAGIDPRFSVLDDTESAWLLKEAVEEAIQNRIMRDHAMKKMVVAFGYPRIVNEVTSLYQVIAGSGLSLDEVRDRTWMDWESAKQEMQTFLAARVEELLVAGDGLADYPVSTKTSQEFRSLWETWRKHIRSSAKDVERLMEVLDALCVFVKKSWGRNPELTKAKNDFKDHVLLPLQERLQAFCYHAFERESLHSLLDLLTETEKRYSRAKREAGGIDFDELQIRALQLLERHEEVRRKVQAQIDFLMVDEFQDTNDLQKRLIRLLVERENEIPKGSLFIVGDPKQSIYRFRGADVTIFSEMQKEIEEMDGRIAPLVNNFRSDPRLIEFVNGFFTKILAGDPSSPNYYRPAVAKGKMARGDTPVECLLIPQKDEREEGEEYRTIEARWIARRIHDLLQEGYRFGDITILFRSMSNVKLYERALAEAAIPFYVVGGRGFYQKQEIRDLVHVLTWLTDRSNRIAWAGMLRSPYVGLSDDALFLLAQAGVNLYEVETWKDISGLSETDREKMNVFCSWFLPLQKQAGRVPVDHLIRELIEGSGIRAILLTTPDGRQSCANLDKFLDFARSFRVQSSSSLLEFLERVELLTEEEVRETEAAIETPDSDSVQLMTIHQSKGLEFPVVILPDLSRVPKHDTSLFYFDRFRGITSCIVDEDEKKMPLRHLDLKQINHRLEQEESVRVLYVAVTRAKERFIFTLMPEEAKEKERRDILEYRKWSEWFDAVMDISGIDRDRGVWNVELSGQPFVIRVLEYDGKGRPSDETIGYSIMRDLFEKELYEPKDSVVPEECAGIEPFVSEGEAPVPLSVSAIMTYSTCPRQYYLAYVLQMPRWEYGGTDEDDREAMTEWEDAVSANGEDRDVVGPLAVSLSPALRGMVAHKVIEILRAPSEHHPLAASEKEIETAIHEAVRQLDVDALYIPYLFPDVKRWINQYVQSDHYRKAAVAKWLNEVRFTLPLNGYLVEGIIDRLSVHEDGTLTVIDFKTNRLREKRDFFIKVKLYMPQLRIYALAAEVIMGRQPDKVALHFLDWGDQYEKRVDSQWMEEALLETERLLQAMKNSKNLQDHPTKPGPHCKSCTYRAVCKAAEEDSTPYRPHVEYVNL
ncbi:ATP-dependent helicase/nuclease subunit A [Collibacillus ludicampi]|uniref:DNA 3'-5' helicase n=1 Tax=Collibacillus ludicampi TaxID=2771369 RepID=A0AAV4LIA9_9BACL|nr:UvrD-helicase domain-containing protein [Collibacillus ludicampi]GIM47511.1 ATP-dependent helicase/nuclease subunit A [Collibacillus ludicampi]